VLRQKENSSRKDFNKGAELDADQKRHVKGTGLSTFLKDEIPRAPIRADAHKRPLRIKTTGRLKEKPYEEKATLRGGGGIRGVHVRAARQGPFVIF